MRLLAMTVALSSAVFAASPPPSSAPPSAKPPSRQAAPMGPFIVFFDRDKSDITPQAAAILDNVAAAWRSSESAQVMLAGNSDSAGPNPHNVMLSEQRADAVKAYLAGRGIPDSAISTVAYGEERLLVETPDGVREPQNRNVQIFFGPTVRS